MMNLLFCSTLALAILGTVPTVTSSGPVSPACLRCICMVESACTMPNPLCQIDVGSLACGPYQIKDAYWQDARLFAEDLMSDWKSCTSTFRCSEEAVQGYMERYAVHGRLGYTPTCEDFARIHSGGPNGYKNPDTVGYWQKVEACLMAFNETEIYY